MPAVGSRFSLPADTTAPSLPTGGGIGRGTGRPRRPGRLCPRLGPLPSILGLAHSVFWRLPPHAVTTNSQGTVAVVVMVFAAAVALRTIHIIITTTMTDCQSVTLIIIIIITFMISKPAPCFQRSSRFTAENDLHQIHSSQWRRQESVHTHTDGRTKCKHPGPAPPAKQE